MKRAVDSTTLGVAFANVIAAAGVGAPFRRRGCKSSLRERVIQFHGTTPGKKRKEKFNGWVSSSLRKLHHKLTTPSLPESFVKTLSLQRLIFNLSYKNREYLQLTQRGTTAGGTHTWYSLKS